MESLPEAFVANPRIVTICPAACHVFVLNTFSLNLQLLKLWTIQLATWRNRTYNRNGDRRLLHRQVDNWILTGTMNTGYIFYRNAINQVRMVLICHNKSSSESVIIFKLNKQRGLTFFTV